MKMVAKKKKMTTKKKKSAKKSAPEGTSPTPVLDKFRKSVTAGDYAHRTAKEPSVQEILQDHKRLFRQVETAHKLLKEAVLGTGRMLNEQNHARISSADVEKILQKNCAPSTRLFAGVGQGRPARAITNAINRSGWRPEFWNVTGLIAFLESDFDVKQSLANTDIEEAVRYAFKSLNPPLTAFKWGLRHDSRIGKGNWRILILFPATPTPKYLSLKERWVSEHGDSKNEI